MPCHSGNPNRIAPRLGLQRAKCGGRFLRGLTRRRRPPTHQRLLLHLLRLPPSDARRRRLRGHQHPSQHTLDPQHAARKHPRDARHPRARRLYHDTLAPGFAHHPHPRAHTPHHAPVPALRPRRFRLGKAVKPREPCVARRADVRHRSRGAAAAGYRGRGARAGRVDHARAAAEGPGNCRAASEHPTRRHGCAVAEGMRTRGGHRQGGCGEGPHEAQVNAGNVTETQITLFILIFARYIQ